MERTALATTQLGDTGMEITRLGFGAWALGGGDRRFGWGDQDDAQSIHAIERALELGINWVDTAAAYGFGRSEQVVGRALEGVRDRPYVFTKCSALEGPGRKIVNDLKRDSVLREADASLMRLHAGPIDLYQIHWPVPEGDIEEGFAALNELKEEGLVRHIGVSNFGVSQLRRIQSVAPVETLQPPYSLIARGVEAELLPYAKREGIGVIAYSPMGSGMLTGKLSRERITQLRENDWRKRDAAFQEPTLSRNLATAARVGAVAERLGVAPGAVAIAWTLRNPAVDGAIVGLRRADQVDELLAGAGLRLSDRDAAELEGR